MNLPALIETLMEISECTEEDAFKAKATFMRVKAIRFGAHDGYVIKHGAFMKADVIRRAIAAHGKMKRPQLGSL